MKNLVIAGTIATLLLAAAVTAAPGHDGKHREHMLDRMSERLDLSADQRSQVESVLREQHEKHKALREETHARLNEILNDDQQAELEKMRAERKQRWLEKRRQWQEKRQQDEPPAQ